jgi:hypothetical protein
VPDERVTYCWRYRTGHLPNIHACFQYRFIVLLLYASFYLDKVFVHNNNRMRVLQRCNWPCPARLHGFGSLGESAQLAAKLPWHGQPPPSPTDFIFRNLETTVVYKPSHPSNYFLPQSRQRPLVTYFSRLNSRRAL